jgi:hypothetical protein
MLRKRLTAYREYNNGDYPDHILFYRDGISESQFGMVITQETPQIDDAIKSMPLNYAKKPCTPKLTFLVVGTRQHSRFYPLTPKKGVPKFDAGMVVTTHVVAPKQSTSIFKATTALSVQHDQDTTLCSRMIVTTARASCSKLYATPSLSNLKLIRTRPTTSVQCHLELRILSRFALQLGMPISSAIGCICTCGL